MQDLITIKTFRRNFEAEQAKELLKANQIEAIVSIPNWGGILKRGPRRFRKCSTLGSSK